MTAGSPLRPSGGYSGYLARAARRWPDHVGLRFEDQTWTYRALNDAADAAASRLAGAGIAAGTRVLMLLENGPEYLIGQFALARLGAVFVTPNPYWTDREIANAVRASQASAAIFAPRFAAVVADLRVAVPAGGLLAAHHQRHCTGRVINWDAPLYIPFSSGTTGLPKGVIHTTASLCGGVEQLRRHLGLSASDRLQIALPLCHIFGATMVAAAMSVGAEVTLFRRFDLEESLRHIKQGAVTVWPMAGTVARRLAECDDLHPDDFASLRFFIWGGSAVPVVLARELTARTGVGFLCSYGMTEAMMVAFNPVDRPDQWRLDSPGYATEGTELRINHLGELEVRGPSVARGYAGVSSAAFGDDGWFATGDLAAIASDGRLTIVERAKDMLKVAGFQVSPVEVEQELSAHPDVAEAAVVGRPDDRTGEAVVAFVVRTDPALSAEHLDSWLCDRLASYKRPRDYRFIESLPRTVGGKVRRGDLRTVVDPKPGSQPNSS
ncbi:AMP-binding protein [Mycobacterium avium subsp. hominissuis]